MIKREADNTTRFLIISLVLVSLLCIAIFSFLAFYMNRRSADTISEVGSIYMSGMNERISMHFGTTIEFRLSHVERLVSDTPDENVTDIQRMREELAYNAEALGFDYLAFYTTDGTFEMIYGDPIEVTDPEPFLKSLNDGEKKVAVGSDVTGKKIVLMGIPAEYPMENGRCTALVAGLPADYIKDILALDEEDALVYSHIIRRDGTFVIRSADVLRDNYFERILAVFKELNGRNAEQYVAELAQAMNANEDYSSVFQIGSERRHMYCTHLPYSEWYLVTVMPYGQLDEAVNGLSGQWILLVLGGCAIILLVLMLIFAKYFSLNRQHVVELEEAREEAVHANKAKSEFLSNMSHDIRTPMNAIVGMTAIAMANIDNTQQVQNCLKKISQSSKHLLGLINDVLDMSKIESGKMTLNVDQVSLREVMDGIVNIVQPQMKAKNQQFDVFIRDISTENVCCDSVRLNQILLNLLSNAVKFTPEGGSIQIALFEEASPRGDDYVRIHIQVKDNGIGMSDDFRAKIFESFTREDSTRVRKTEGTGLGMAITKYIVDAMDGTIEVQSELGKGTEFNVILDLEKAEVQEVDMILPEWNMLVVDDDDQLCQSTVYSLNSIGVKADWTLDGETAIDMIDERHRKHDDYHVILLDWKLPGMDGIETAREIRHKLGEEIPIILISAYDWSEIEEDARAAGVSGFIAKPLFKSTLFHGLKQYADSSGQISELHEEKNTNLIGRRILLAEDNDLNWEIADVLLGDLGLQIQRAENGKICVEKFEQSPIGFYDAILMDLRMPVMTGYEASKAIRALNRSDNDIPIIAMTADAFSEDIKRCLECGMNAHIAKPIDVLEVARILEKYIKLS